MTLFLDWSNAMYRCLFVSRNQDPFDEEFKLWKHILFKSLMEEIKRFSPNEVVIAGDGRNPWRKSIYPEYKAGRGKGREESPVDFDKFFEVANEFWLELKETFPNIRWLKKDRIEADDIVGVLVKDLHKECTAVTTDKDYIQLLKYPGFKLFNPIKREEVKSINPKMDLDVKCICGDGSDNIPGIKRGVGPKRAERLLTEGILDEFLEKDHEAKEAYVLNRQLIDMDNIPMDVRNEIIGDYRGYVLKPFDGERFKQFIMKNSPSMILDTASLSTQLREIGSGNTGIDNFVE